MRRSPTPALLPVSVLAAACLLALGAGCGGGGGATTGKGAAPALPKRAAFSLPVSPVSFGKYTVVPLLGAAAAPYAGPATPHSLTKAKVAAPVEKALRNDGVAAALAKNGFVVVPSTLHLFQSAYEGNVYGGWPDFVTTDVAYHEWHLVFDKILRSLEQDVLLPKLDKLVSGSLAAAHAQTVELHGTPLEDAASRVEQLFQVAAAELGHPVQLGPLAAEERALVDAHSAASASPLFAVKVDYSLFKPRGHYARNAKLMRYFVATSVLGQLPFCLPGTTGCKEIAPARAAVLAARILAGHADLLALWRAIYEPTAFLVGRADDYTPLEVAAAAKTVDPGWLRDVTAFGDDATVAKTIGAVVAARPVLVNPERAAVRFLGTRFVVDSYVLDQLIYPNVDNRLMPSGLDLAAAFGSHLAYDTLKRQGVTALANYDSQLTKMRKAITARPARDWGSTVYDAWLYALQPMFVAHGRAFPDFMRTTLWAAKDLQSGLGSYAQLKHDTVLYTKQFFAEGGDQLPPSPRNWVEPDPAAFGRLAAAALLLQQGLHDRSLLTPVASRLLREASGMFTFFERIAKDELAARPIAKADNNRLRFIGGEFEKIRFETSDETREGTPAPDQSDSIVADIGSSPKGVLELATGRVDRIFVIVPDGGGGFEVAVGGVYSYYEFTSPPGTRLDDTTWRAMLDKGAVPAQPAWTKPFTAGKPGGSELPGGGF
jgi:Protein of unknown function (DUF3160)